MRDLTLSNKELEKYVKPGMERELCFLMLYQIFENNAYSNLVIKTIDSSVNGEKIQGNLVRAMVYGTVTYSYSIDFLLRHIAGRDVDMIDPGLRTLLRMGAWQVLFSDSIPEYAAVSSTVEVAKKYFPGREGFVNGILRALSSADDEKKRLSNYKPEIRTSLKPELFGIIRKSYGKDRAVSIADALLKPQLITIRFNRNVISKNVIEDRLSCEGFQVTDSSFMPEALSIVSGIGRLNRSESFNNGDFFVQGEGAMLASVIADPKPGDVILDCCSAPGGKATHMAQLSGDECEITSVDISESRVGLINENVERLGIKSIKAIVGDATDLGEIKDSSCDIVMCDVPCSGLGLLGRKPDIRLNASYMGIQELLPIQKEILDTAKTKVKVGGYLVYCTCTLNSEENEGRVKEFLSANPDFEAVDITKYLPDNLSVDDERNACAKNGYITLFPDIDEGDGFFISKMRRKN